LPFGLWYVRDLQSLRHREEAARDLGATPWQTLRSVIVRSSCLGIGVGSRLHPVRDEIARSSQAMGEHTLPMELQR
jgi:putative spermidine/putrescine transport system permease protein